MGGPRKVLHVATIVGSGLGAGAQLFVRRALIPARRDWSPSMAAQVHQDAMTHRPESYLRPTAVITALCSIALLTTKPRRHATLFTIGGLAGVIANGAISAKWEWPINREINSWSTDAVPANYAQLRDTWDEKHVWRTVASILAFASFALAGLSSK